MKIARYRKKPVVVYAVLLEDEAAMYAAAAWCGGKVNIADNASDPSVYAIWLSIPTLEGVMIARLGEWLIRGVAGEFYPCKPAIFDATYEEEPQP